jgi:hypothetical protein
VVNGALRRFLEKTRHAGPPYATALDQYAELRAVTPDSLQYLLTDLFETVTLWDVRTERASVQPTGTGAFEVTLDVVAKKTRADSVGVETEVPMNDLVEIGVFAPPAEGADAGEQLYLTRHRVRSGKQTIRVTVPKAPARAGIDPYNKLIDRDREDNVVAVKPLVDNLSFRAERRGRGVENVVSFRAEARRATGEESRTVSAEGAFRAGRLLETMTPIALMNRRSTQILPLPGRFMARTSGRNKRGNDCSRRRRPERPCLNPSKPAR